MKYIPDPDGFWSYKTFQIETFCCPGATFDDITSFSEYKRLVKKNFDIIILFLGGNDIRNECNIADLYTKLKTLIDDLNNTIIPKFGIFFLEPEARLGNPKFVSQKGYYRLRNSLVRKVKSRKEIIPWTLLGKGLNLHHLEKDGVHFNKLGRQKFREIIQEHLDEKIAKIDEEKTRKRKVITREQSPSTSQDKTNRNRKIYYKNKTENKKNNKQREGKSEGNIVGERKEENNKKELRSKETSKKLKKD